MPEGGTAFHVRLSAGAGSGAVDGIEISARVGAAPEGTDLSDGLARLIAEVEIELGGSLSELPRAQKQPRRIASRRSSMK